LVYHHNRTKVLGKSHKTGAPIWVPWGVNINRPGLELPQNIVIDPTEAEFAAVWIIGFDSLSSKIVRYLKRESIKLKAAKKLELAY
jgi:hypothetical protein